MHFDDDSLAAIASLGGGQSIRAVHNTDGRGVVNGA